MYELLQNGGVLRRMLEDFREKFKADSVSALRGLTLLRRCRDGADARDAQHRRVANHEACGRELRSRGNAVTDRRLIEVAFPLKQASLDSVHEKNVRHGHISTLHIWPARRPLAACRAALIATLLPDPGHAGDATRTVRAHRRQGHQADREEEGAWREGRGKGRREDGRRHPSLGTRDGEQGGHRVLPPGDPQGIRRARASRARPVCRRRRDPA